MFYDAVKNDHGFQYDPFKALVAPRPIGWISSYDSEGRANLAPYSYFNAFAQAPHYIAYGSGQSSSSRLKDSISNIKATEEFAINLATWELREKMNESARNAPSDVDEFELAGLEKADCVKINAPRVAASPWALECKLFKTVDLPGDDGNVHDHLVIARVLGIHIDDRFINEGRVDTAAMKPLARLGYSEYAVVEEVFRMRRPD